MMVSCVSQEGIKDLQERIHYAAVNAVDPDTKEHIIGMQVREPSVEFSMTTKSGTTLKYQFVIVFVYSHSECRMTVVFTKIIQSIS